MRMILLPVIAMLTTLGSEPPTARADLAALVAETPANGVLNLPADRVFSLSRPLMLTRPITIVGHGAKVAAADGAGIAGALIRSAGIDAIRLSELDVDANVDRGGADYGIWITGGNHHRIDRVTIRNSSQACLLLEDAEGEVQNSRVERCGRDLTLAKGTAANNHGIMIAALSRPVSGVRIRSNVVQYVDRKGIAVYARMPGRLADVIIADNRVSDCGLGGIYVANAPGSGPQHRIGLSGNTVGRSYVDFQVDDVAGLDMANNTAVGTRARDGGAGGAGLVLNGVIDARIRNMEVRDSGAAGIVVRRSSGVRLIAPLVIDANVGRYAFAPGIHLSDTQDSRVENLSVVDRRARPLATHGVVENDGSRSNSITIRRIAGVAQGVVRRP